MKINKKHTSPNFDERAKGTKIEMLVLHYTGMRALEGVIEKLSDPEDEKRVSAHYLIDRNGDIYQLVEEEKRAWHAGISSWQGKDDVNSRSIGIEIMNNGSEPFPKAQMKAVAALSKEIIARHGITTRNVVGHSDIAPDRKYDPGPFFPWKKLAAQGIGAWPELKIQDHFNTAAIIKDEEKLKKLFNKAGYGVDVFGENAPSLSELVGAFQSRYQQKIFSNDNKTPGVPTKKTVAKLRAVIRSNRKPT